MQLFLQFLRFLNLNFRQVILFANIIFKVEQLYRSNAGYISCNLESAFSLLFFP